MLYIEASQINSNGGIVLLDLLLRRIKERNIDAIIYIGYGHVLNRLKYLEKYQTCENFSIQDFCQIR